MPAGTPMSPFQSELAAPAPPLPAWGAAAGDARDGAHGPLAPGAVRPRGRLGTAWWVGLGALLAMALGLRLTGLGQGLWFDEIRTLVSYVRLPLPQIVTTFDSQNQHLLYSVLARLSVVALGDGAWALRLPAALLGVASLWATFWFGRRITTDREAVLAAVLLAASYHHVWFSQNARGYTGLLLVTLLGTGLFLELLAEARPAHDRRWLGYAVVMALGHYTHSSAVFVTAAHGLVWLALLARGRRLTRASVAPGLALVAAGVLTLLLYAPVLPQLLATMLAETHGGVGGLWQRPGWFVAETLRGLAGGLPGGWVALAAGGAVLLVGVASYARRSATVLALLVVPGVITAVALLVAGHNLWPRFFFFAAGFAALIVVRGLAAAAERLVPTRAPLVVSVAVALAALGSLTTVPAAWGPKQDFAGAAAYLATERAPGDAIVSLDMTGLVYSSYLEPAAEPVHDLARLEALERAHARTWVLYTFPDRLAAVQPEIWRRLAQEYRPVASFPGTVNGGTVYLVVHDDPPHRR